MNSINIKAHCNGNIRRFQSQALWTVFSTDLQALFSFDTPVVIQYRDDENDLCQISSQMELEFAASQSSTLTVYVTKPDQVQTPLSVPVPSAPVKECPKLKIDEVPAHIRGDRLATRLAFVQKKLESPTLPEHRREKLMMKKSKLEEAIQLRSSPVDVPKKHEKMAVEVHEQTRQCRGRKNPADRLLRIDQALSNPNLPPKRMERLKLQKAKLEALNSEVAPAQVVASPAPEAVLPLVPLRGPAARLAAIEKLLAQPDLHPRRAEKLTEKKAKLEEFLRERETKTAPEVKVSEVAIPLRGPEARLARITKMLAANDLPAHRMKKLMNQKAEIEQRMLFRADVAGECQRGRRDRDLGVQQKPRGARLIVKRK
jgi:hypothetical protein